MAHNGIINGTIDFTTPGRFATGARGFSGSNYISLVSGTVPNTAFPFTMELWLKSGLGGYQQIALSTGTLSAIIWIGQDRSGCLHVGAQGYGDFVGTTPIDDAVWHHVAVVAYSDHMDVYMDGSRVATQTGTPPTYTSTAGVLGNLLDLSTEFDGEIDEVAFWNIARYTGSTYTVPTAAYTGTESGIVALFHLDTNADDYAQPPVAPSWTVFDVQAAVGSPFTLTLETSGTTPITYSVSAGALPPGLSLSSDMISGTPTVSGTYAATITATNGVGSVSQQLSFAVAPASLVGTSFMPFVM